MQLNIYLHNTSVQDYQDCLDAESPPAAVQRSPSVNYRIYHTVNENIEGPPWLKGIKHVMKPAAAEVLTNRLCGVAIILRINTGSETRFFSACFGIGHTLLRKSTVEHNFGLRTTINSVVTLRRCSSRLLSTETRQKSVVTNYDARVRELGFDFDEEILALASGKCPENDLGTMISGTDSLKLSSSITFEQMAAKLVAIYSRFQEKTYRKNGFDFIDQIELVRDVDMLDELDAHLIAGFNKPGTMSIGLMAPIDASGDDVSEYKVCGLRKTARMAEVTLDELRDYAGEVDQEMVHESIKIQGFDGSGTSVTIRSPLYSYLTCEVELRKGKQIRGNYVLANRKWYRVEADFLKKIRTQLQHYLCAYSGPPLRPWTRATVNGKLSYDEGVYNSAYAAERDFLVLDKKKFTNPGYGRGNGVEVADLFHLPTRTLICVKKNTRSATLSHLFAQASVSAEMFDEVDAYRKDFIAAVRNKWPRDRSVAENNLKDLTFVYVIGSEQPPAKATLADGVQALPVFSRVNMRKHVKAIRALGHSVTLTYVPMI